MNEQKENIKYVINHEYEYARRVLKHYFHLCVIKSGGSWDYDNDAELDGFIDSIQKAVEYQIKLALLERSEK